MKISKILAPADFSELGNAAVKHAVALAKWFNSDLIFAHVCSPELFRYYGTEGGAYVAQVVPSREDALAEAGRRLERLAQDVSGGLPASKVVLEGDPAEEIVRYAQQNQIDLIVMPTRGFGAFRRFILGSVTAKILHDTDCPVFTCPHGADLAVREPHPYRHVACAVDLGPHSLNVLKWAGDFAAACGADLTVIHAAPMLRVGGQDLGAEVRKTLLEAVHEVILDLLRQSGHKAQICTDSAELTEFVPRTAASLGADLLVIGRTSKEGSLGRLRANTYALIRESPCPVVSL